MSKYQGNFRYKRPSEGEYNLIANFISLGNYFIYFDGMELDNNSILSLHQSGKLFTDNFKLGSTLCREVDLTVLKSAVSEHPSEVLIKDVNNVVKFTLQVDSVDDTNIDFYDYVLVDKMVNLNQVYDYSRATDTSVQTILNGICTDLLNCPPVTVSYGGDINLNFSEDINARQIVSWIAELNASFARIDELGNLQIIKYENTDPFEVDINTCENISIGEYHKIDRVYLDLGVFAYGYPSTNQFNTVYLNPDNQLISDNGGYTRESIVQHVYNEINGFEFYSLSSGRCLINQDSIAGDQLVFYLGEERYPTIAQIDWDFNIEWYGGYSLEVETKIQQETNNIESTDKKINSVRILVDRQNGEILQEINQVSENLNQQTSSLQQTASALEVRVANNETSISDNATRMSSFETAVSITADGVRISQGTEGAYVKFTDSGMEIYVQGTKTAWAEADGYSATELMIGDPNASEKWHLHEANNGNTLMFLRR